MYLCGYRDYECQRLSDYTCTALQLANFWQDISADYAKARIYLPLEDLRRFGVSEDEIRAGRNTTAFREMLRFEVARAREWFTQGLPLASKVSRELAIDIELFSRGGLEILNAIERQDYAVLGRRPAISKTRKLALVARATLGKLLRVRPWGMRPCNFRRRRLNSMSLIRFADTSPVRRPEISITALPSCRDPNAIHSARCMRSCGAATTSRMTTPSPSTSGATS
jgi:hypothetical protein